jgi:hypothetical protein
MDPEFGKASRRIILINQAATGYWFPYEAGIGCFVQDVRELTAIGDQFTFVNDTRFAPLFVDTTHWYAGIGYSKRDQFGTRGRVTNGVAVAITLKPVNCPAGGRYTGRMP